MADILDTVEARIIEILEQNRGAAIAGVDPSIPLPTGLLRRPVGAMSVRDERDPPKQFDRVYQIEWAERTAVPRPQNQNDGWQRRNFRFRLDVAYVFGSVASQFTHPVGAETASDLARAARKRALSESERIARALTCARIFQDTPGADVTLVDCFEDGPSTIELRPPTRLICSTPYVAWVSYRRTANLAP